MIDTVAGRELLRLSAQIVSAHAAYNTSDTKELLDLLQSVYAALNRVGTPEQPGEALSKPAVPIKKSVFPGYIVCLEDGKKLKTLKRHLQSSYGLTPDQYRAKWQLPAAYPMVAPDYAARRSSLAKQAGLGRKAAEAASDIIVQKIPAGVRGRKPKPKAPQPAAQAVTDLA